MSTADQALAVAVAAAVAAVLLLLAVIWLWLQLRRVRTGQKLLLGTDQQDLVEYAVGLLTRVEAVEGAAQASERRVEELAGRLRTVVQRRSLIRYDALDGAGGRQSASLALLDDLGSGVVVTAIQDREYARIYIKELREWAADIELSPEEQRAVDAARGGRTRVVTGPVQVRQAEARDRPQLLRLAAEQVADGETFTADRTEAVLDAGIVFVAEAEHHLAGYVALEERADTLVLHQLVVCQADDHRGVGNRLLDWAEGYGVSRGLRRLSIEVENENRAARSFYARRGYLADAAGGVRRELTHA